MHCRTLPAATAPYDMTAGFDHDVFVGVCALMVSVLMVSFIPTSKQSFAISTTSYRRGSGQVESSRQEQ